MKGRIPWPAHALGILVLSALVVGAALPRVPARARRGFADALESVLYRARGARSGDPRIVLAAIDDESLSRIGDFPWRRSVSARLIDALTRFGARTIVFDVMFIDPSAHPADDKALAEAARKSGRVVFATFLNRSEGGRPEERQDVLPEVARAAAGLGNVSVTDSLEPDGTIRTLPSRMPSAGHPDLYPLGLAAAAQYLHLDPGTVAAGLPARIRLDYRGPGSVRQISVSHILDDQLTPAETAALRDAMVYVGSVSSRAFDLHPSPFGGQISGPQTQLTLADNILDHRWFVSPRPAVLFVLCALPAALLLAWAVSLSTAACMAAAAGAALAFALADWTAFALGFWLRPDILLAVLLSGLAWLFAARALRARVR